MRRLVAFLLYNMPKMSDLHFLTMSLIPVASSGFLLWPVQPTSYSNTDLERSIQLKPNTILKSGLQSFPGWGVLVAVLSSQAPTTQLLPSLLHPPMLSFLR